MELSSDSSVVSGTTPDFRDIALNMGLGDGQFLTPLRKSAKEHYFIDTVAKVS